MPDNVVPALKNILFIRSLVRVVVMNHIWHAIFISPVGDNPDVILEDHDIAALPVFDIMDICCKADSVVFEKYLQIFYAPEIDVFVRLLDIIIIRVLLNIIGYKIHKIITCRLKCVRNDIRADPVTVIRITGGVIFALVFWMRIHIVQRTLKNICLVIYSISVLIMSAVKLRYVSGILVGRPERGCVLISKKEDCRGANECAGGNNDNRKYDFSLPHWYLIHLLRVNFAYYEAVEDSAGV